MYNYIRDVYIHILYLSSLTCSTFAKVYKADNITGRTELLNNGTFDSFMEILPAFQECSTWDNCASFYTEQPKLFRCRFPIELFEKNIRFELGLWNGHHWNKTDDGIEDDFSISSEDQLFYTKTSQIKFIYNNTRYLSCYAQRKNSSESDTVYQFIQVIESIPAKVMNMSKEVILATNETSILSCTAVGNPCPTFTWKNDAKEYDITSNESNGSYCKSTITISPTFENSTTVFSCNASNFRSSDILNITVHWIKSSLPTVLIPTATLASNSIWLNIIWIASSTALVILIVSATIFGKQRISQLKDYMKSLSPELFTNKEAMRTGHFGITYSAEMREKGKPIRKVVMKELKESGNKEHARFWKIELDIHNKLRSHRKDPNMNYIVEYIGFVWHRRGKEFYQIVLEYCEEEDLRTFLKNNQPLMALSGYEEHTIRQKPQVEITVEMMIRWGYEVTCAMEFLAKNRIIHGDLAARNVLLKKCDGKFVTKLTDFGLSKQLQKNESGEYAYTPEDKNRTVPVSLCSIEVLEGRKFTEHSDVWAFGVFMYEVFTFGDEPYSQILNDLPKEVTQQNGLKEFLKEGKRLEQPSAAPDSIYTMMRKCWAETPSERGTFSELKNNLEKSVISIQLRIESQRNTYLHSLHCQPEMHSYTENEL